MFSLILIFVLLYSRYMAKEKAKKNGFNWGGRRPGAGRPKGSGSKVRICVSVNRWNWQAATRKWKIASHLVDRLLVDYLGNSGGIQGTEAL
jgi:hypothetical protein